VRHLSAVSPLGQIRAMQPRVEAIEHRLTQAMSRALSQRQQKIEALSRHLSAVGPASVLGRGYTYTLDAQGRPVTQAAGLQPGQRMTTVFADGKVRSVVEGGDQPAAASPAASPDPAPQPASPPKRPRRKAESAGPMLDLFSQSSQDDA
jgi:exonuclease VII large subunit